MAAPATARKPRPAARAAAKPRPQTRRPRRTAQSAQRSAQRSTQRRRPPAARRQPASRRAAPRTGWLVPVAVGRTAVAVGGLADSGAFVRLTRGRLWIGLLAALLVGIVALNVLALSFSASSSKTAAQVEDLAQQNSALRAQLATAVSDERVQAEAAELGLVVPAPGAIRYVEPQPDDAAEAARRLRDDQFGDPAYVAPPVVPDETYTAEDVPVDPAAMAPAPEDTVTDPAATDPAVTEAAAMPTDPVATGGVAP